MTLPILWQKRTAPILKQRTIDITPDHLRHLARTRDIQRPIPIKLNRPTGPLSPRRRTIKTPIKQHIQRRPVIRNDVEEQSRGVEVILGELVRLSVDAVDAVGVRGPVDGAAGVIAADVELRGRGVGGVGARVEEGAVEGAHRGLDDPVVGGEANRGHVCFKSEGEARGFFGQRWVFGAGEMSS